jgi:hypothetical protein
MVVIRYQSFAANAVLTHRFQSVATCSSQAGNGSLLSKVTRVPLRAPFGSIFFRDFCRPLVGWSFGAPLKFLQEPSGCLSKCFHALRWFVGFHANQPMRRQKVWRTQIKGISSP